MARHSPYALINLITLSYRRFFIRFSPYVFAPIAWMFLSYCFLTVLDFHLQLFRKIMFSFLIYLLLSGFQRSTERVPTLSKLNKKLFSLLYFLLRKEVIHPHVPVGIPCYDLTPVIGPTFDGSLLAVRPPVSGITSSHGLTGGVYKARERIHRDVLIRDY